MIRLLPSIIFVSAFFLAGCILPSTRVGMMDHGQMNHGMMRQGTTVDAGGTSTLLSGKDIDLSTLPEARTSETINVKDGDTIDLNPEIVKKTVRGNSFAFYGYNGQFPGPLLKVQQGSTFTVRMKNKIDQPTSIHWHGVRLENRFDGAVGVTQEAIQPGDSFTYTVTVPDDGMYWYHPHVREDVQQDLGLYGGLLVAPKDVGAYPPVNHEEVVFLDDILLSDKGLPLSYGKNEADHALMGRFGNTLMANGDMADYRVSTHSGSVVRFSFVNAANTRTFRLAFDEGAAMKLIGGDGGLLEHEQFIDHLILSPSERAIVDVYFPKARTYSLTHQTPGSNTVTVLANITADVYSFTEHFSKRFSQETDQVATIADIDALRPFFDKTPDAVLHLSVQQKMMGEMGHGMMMDHGSTVDGIEWEDAMPMMNAVATKANTQWKLIDGASRKENMDIKYSFTKGDKVKIRLMNDASDKGSDHPMQHPIHFHGQRFLVLSVNGKPNENLVWKDTVLVPKDGSVDILLEASNPGDWMMHCHIAEHLSNGMMGMFSVH